MKRISLFALTLGTAFLSGCFSIDHAISPVTGEENVLVQNYGWQLFGCVPLACGNASDPASGTRHGPWAFFRDDVTSDKIQKRLTDYAATRKGKKLTNLQYYNCDTVFVTIYNIPIPIPYLICYHEIQLSGVIK